MKMNFGLDLVQSQKLNLTKELKQSLEILQMHRFELESLINEELNENPTLEAEKKDEIDWEKYLRDLSENSYRTARSYYESADDDFVSNPENYIAEKENLYDHLKNQLHLLDLSRDVQKAAFYIIRTLDKDGYFREEVESAARNANTSVEIFGKALSAVQSLEPAGIGARSVEECLLIQLSEQSCVDQTLRRMIKEDLALLAAKRYELLCRKYEVDEERMKMYMREIRSLNPRPAASLSEDENAYVLPDVFVEKDERDLTVRLNNDCVPKLKIDAFYKKLLQESEVKEARDYIKERLNRSLFLIRSVEQRKNTILRVAEEIVEMQRDFLLLGKGHLKSMVLRDIAEKTGFHESTISRAVNGKYMLTPMGLFEFRFFFTSGVSGGDGEMVSNRNIKERIRALIEEEDKKRPLSDQKICNILCSEGINISRRTVAKYREEEGILSSSGRREI
ncbi:MAG: RNA polymerase factor sigma-54 [Peptostreptococcaceae bacterium]|nr:RNA polymerase factor sigma-54 [Peptostreptococcaceae bacterium]